MSDDRSGSEGGASADKVGLLSKIAPVTEQERQVAQHAKAEFDKGNYDACISSLGKVLILVHCFAHLINQNLVQHHTITLRMGWICCIGCFDGVDLIYIKIYFDSLCFKSTNFLFNV